MQTLIESLCLCVYRVACCERRSCHRTRGASAAVRPTTVMMAVAAGHMPAIRRAARYRLAESSRVGPKRPYARAARARLMGERLRRGDSIHGRYPERSGWTIEARGSLGSRLRSRCSQSCRRRTQLRPVPRVQQQSHDGDWQSTLLAGAEVPRTYSHNMPDVPKGVGSGLSRDLEILEALAEAMARTGEGLRLTEVAITTNRDKSQVSRGLRRLERAGLVTCDSSSRRFLPGWRLFRLASMTAEARLLRTVQPAMRKIMVELGETVHLCVLRGTSAVTLHSEVPRHGFRGLSWVGVDAPAHTFTAGRVLLAEWSEDEIRSAYPMEVLPDVPATGRIRTRTDLLAECARIRERGYALVDEEFETGLVGASAAVRDFRGIAVASLNVAAPRARMIDQLDSVGRYVAQVARGVSQDLDWTPAPTRTKPEHGNHRPTPEAG